MYRMVLIDGRWTAVDDTEQKTEVPQIVSRITADTPLTHRHGWILSLEQGMKPSEICNRFHISRKTFYKWLQRYKQGDALLADRSRRPHHIPKMTPKSVIDLLAQEKAMTGYGQRRLRQHMINKHNITISERTIWKHLKNRKEGS